MDESSAILMALGIFAFISLVLFLVLREIVTWYWKINKAIGLLEKIEENTREYSVDNEVKKEEVKMDSLD